MKNGGCGQIHGRGLNTGIITQDKGNSYTLINKPTWEPLRGTDLDTVACVHEYLRSHGMKTYIPKRYASGNSTKA